MRFILIFAAIVASAASASEWQDTAALKKLAEAYARSETSGLPGKVTVSAAGVDPRLRLAACPAPEAYTPTGTRLWGKSILGIRCNQPQWSISIPVTVTVFAEAVAATRPLTRNHTLEAADLARRETDLTQLPASVLTDPSQAIGKLATLGIPAGTFLQNTMLRAPFLVLEGQKVRLVAQGSGFKVSTEGKALSNASAGQVVTVRTGGGKLVSGVVKSAGVVEVAF